MKKIVMTGGGTAGHVTPHFALIPELRERDYEITYIGSYSGIEKGLIEKMNIPYYGVSTGKLRRYHSMANFKDPFNVIKGYFESVKILKKVKPDVVFSKGGFVSVPVVYAAKRCHVPCIIHESDITPGLANKLCVPKAVKVCTNFPETERYFPKKKCVVTGTPIRKELLNGDKEKGYAFTGMSKDKPVITIVGGSTGSAKLNDAVRNLLPTLLKDWQVVHLCGKGKGDPSFDGIDGYRQFEYVSEELCDVFAISDIVISRAGANAITELLALKKLNILVPLSTGASRGDQILNADVFETNGYSYVLREEDMSNDTLLRAIEYVSQNRDKYIEKMSAAKQNNATEMIIDMIEYYADRHAKKRR